MDLQTMKRCSRKNRGFSIIELMVAVAISMILMAGVLSIFISNKQTFEISDDLSRLQENARFAVEFIARDVRMAGYFGCADSLGTVLNHVNPAGTGYDQLFDTSNPVEGHEEGDTAWQPSGNTTIPGTLGATTDAIAVRYVDPSEPITVDTPYMPQASGNIKISQPNTLQKGDIVAVTDCESTDVFQISGPDTGSSADKDLPHLIHTTGNATSPGNAQVVTGSCPGANAHCLSKIYEGDARIIKLAAYRYFLDDDPVTGIPALFRQGINVATVSGTKTAQAQNTQLVDGIENLQVLWGEDTSGDRAPNIYVKTGAVTDWNNVISARIGILARTIDEYGTQADTQTYDLFNGTTGCTVGASNPGCVDPADLRVRRRSFSTTIVMRNLQ